MSGRVRRRTAQQTIWLLKAINENVLGDNEWDGCPSGDARSRYQDFLVLLSTESRYVSIHHSTVQSIIFNLMYKFSVWDHLIQAIS